MRTTIEIKDEHRARLLELAARRGEKGFSRLVGEAIELLLQTQAQEHERRQLALLMRAALDSQEADDLEHRTREIREEWR